MSVRTVRLFSVAALGAAACLACGTPAATSTAPGSDAVTGDSGAGPEVATAHDATATLDAGNADGMGAADTQQPSDSSVPGDAAGDTGPVAADAQADGAAGGCPGPQPSGATCQGGKWVCAVGFFPSSPGGSCLEATCENMQKAFSAVIDTAAQAASACVAAEDCVVVATSTACQGSCGVPVDETLQNDVLAAVIWVDENICKPMKYADKCGYATPKCMAPKTTCTAGHCAWGN